MQTISSSIHTSYFWVLRRQTYFWEGSSEWSALASSNRWNRYIIWTVVSVSGFGIVWSLFAQVDETVSATGKLEPGTTIDVKAPLGGVIKNILVKDGQFVQIGQRLIELDTTAAQARLDALLDVRNVPKSICCLVRVSSVFQLTTVNLILIKNSGLTPLSKSSIPASQNSVLQAEAQLDASNQQLKQEKGTDYSWANSRRYFASC